MVPDKSHPRFRELVTGQYAHSFPIFSANMCLSNNLRKVRAGGASPTIVSAAIDDMHAFFVKFEADISDDLRRIFG